MAHLYPHQLRGEGHFLARLRKKGTEESFLEPMEGEKLDARCGKFLSEVMPEYAVRKSFVQGEWIYALPEEMPQMTRLADSARRSADWTAGIRPHGTGRTRWPWLRRVHR